MLLDRTDEEDDITLPSSTTRCKNLRTPLLPLPDRRRLVHGYDGIILEVSEASNVVSVTLF